ncbi:hypothetical protein VF21_08929 [Pseudogymnoascus sp. 05NY08]|nr:hypothetical protein VF21_08924 [Pseudogymnoascus sp. 05NY08]OBT73140.1 hypothetical protein VF21_08929 [Pseudogymnoascus sp. 05NY08]
MSVPQGLDTIGAPTMTGSSRAVSEKQHLSDEGGTKTADELVHLEGPLPKNGSLTEEEEEFLASIVSEQANHIYHKVDKRLLPVLALLYLVAQIDRANIGNAKIEGMTKDLHMTGVDYNVALAIFFVPYILLEVPSNLVLVKFKRPSHYVGLLVICWGIVITCTGVVQNRTGLYITRFFLGVFEAGFFPGAMHIISQWYPPAKVQLRMSAMYASSALSGAFSGLLAYAIAKMNGVGGYEGWRWIFILEGIASVAAGVACCFLLPDTPSLSTIWLEPEESRYLQFNHAKTRGRGTTKSNKNQFRILIQILTDWQLYLLALVFMASAAPTYGLKFNMPQIIKEMGFSTSNAQLLTVPPYVVGAISALINAFFADRFTWRMPAVAVATSLVVLSFSVLFVKAGNISNNVALCYFFVHVALAGVYPIPPAASAWTANNLGPATRAAGLAFMTSVGNLGGIIGSFIYMESEAPTYPTGYGTSLAMAAAGMCASFTLDCFYLKINKARASQSEESIREKYTDEELEAMDDRSPLFRYNL